MPVRLSWSAMQKFLSCQRAYELNYLEGLEKKPSADKKNLLRGSAFHAGLEAALQCFKDNSAVSTTTLVTVAKGAARQYIEKITIPNKTFFNWDTRQEEPDEKYYDMLGELFVIVPELLAYHIPLIGLGERYVPATKGMVKGLKKSQMLSGGEDDELAVEWKFQVEWNDEGDTLSGIVDTILWDKQEQEFLLVDWKTRDGFPHDSMALLDGQLHLYAGVMNEYFGANIARVAMWQFLTKSPAPASISKKTNLPNTGAASYATTWAVWCATLPFGINPAKYEAKMRPKLWEDADFQRVVKGEVTATSSKLMFDNVQAVLSAVKHAIGKGDPMPAVLGSTACKWCDFAKLCANAFRYGGDPSQIIERDYQKKSPGGSLEVLDDGTSV